MCLQPQRTEYLLLHKAQSSQLHLSFDLSFCAYLLAAIASMRILRLHSRERCYRVSVATSRTQEATWELESLQIRFMGPGMIFNIGNLML